MYQRRLLGNIYRRYAYAESLYVIENMVVVCKVIAWYDIDARVFLYLPVSQSQTLALGEQVTLRQLSTPVSLGGFLKVAHGSHAGEPKN